MIFSVKSCSLLTVWTCPLGTGPKGAIEAGDVGFIRDGYFQPLV